MIKRVKIINKTKFVILVLNEDNENFVIYIAALTKLITMLIYPFYQAQIALLTSKKIGISIEYSDILNVLFSNSAMELPKYTRINNHFINLLDNRKLPYSLIYSLGPVDLKILKTYIKARLASGFIRLSKSFAGTLILFI